MVLLCHAQKIETILNICSVRLKINVAGGFCCSNPQNKPVPNLFGTCLQDKFKGFGYKLCEQKQFILNCWGEKKNKLLILICK